MVGLLHSMAFMVLLLVGWVICNNKPLPLPLGFSLCDVTKMACFWIFDQLFQAVDANPLTHFLAQTFFGNLMIISVFRTLDGPCSISGTRIMAQKTHFAQKSKNCRKSMSLPLTASSDKNTSSADYARELFKPSKDSWSLVVTKNF